MRCLILAGDGMLGHQLLASLSPRHDVRVTLRGTPEAYAKYGLFDHRNSYYEVDVAQAPTAERTGTIERIIAEFEPEAIVNAVGIIKQRKDADARHMLEVNAVFPRRLLSLCQARGIRLIQFGTDCVFNGRRGNYQPTDPIDAEDVYGLSKYLGELTEAPAITLRSSIIGLELSRKASLVEWFLAQIAEPNAVVRGFTHAIYSGLTTIEMARVVELCLTEHRDLCGVRQVASAPISKFELLSQLAAKLGRCDVTIVPDDSLRCDRSLSGQAFTARTGYHAPHWNTLLDELAEQIQRRGTYAHAA